MKNIVYKSKSKLTPWRKISLGSWKPKGDSSIYAIEEIEVTSAIEFCKEKNISLHCFVIKALSITLEKHPQINSVIRFGKIFRRKEISVFSHALPNIEYDDLSGVKIKEGHIKNIENINKEFHSELKKVQNGTDLYVKPKKGFKFVPALCSKIVLDFLSYIMYSLNIHFNFFPSLKDPFGSIMLTNIGSLGISKALCPIAPYTRIPMVVSMGCIELKPWIKNDNIIKAKIISFGFTFDHRIMDGVHYGLFSKTFKRFFTNPKMIL